MPTEKQTILTGDRPTGPLHLGHYVGSLKNRVTLQDEYDEYILIADVQALTDNFDNPQKVRENIMEVALDYLAVGIDPERATIVIQSQVPELAELMQYLMNMTTTATLERNPTLKAEMAQKGYGTSIPVGFYTYPISQAADITGFGAHLVPVGDDQLPMIEQTREIVRKFNTLYGDTLIEPKELLSTQGRLCGTDGGAKMSKSLKNVINLSDPREVVTEKVRTMYTDPNRVHATDPGKVEGNTVFVYLHEFGTDAEKVRDLEERYRRGAVGDVEVKQYLDEELNTFLDPIRTRRASYSSNPEQVRAILTHGIEKGRERVRSTMERVRHAMQIDYFAT